ncbi:hypothetical protein Echvi_1995 [Echinicola vietnamensis DSM 17526]|uniref:DUF4440 domain-containing protein n=2 Tax=Echinicola TaxID=390846 RepID=L0FYX5_ECHVK|nr:hypothetical protein Echvi_1995 [Echinicola vietnamensis DSM 17526]
MHQSRIIMLTLLLLAGFSFSSSKAQGSLAEEEQVKAVVQKLFQGLKERDPEALNAVFADHALLETVQTHQGDTTVKREVVKDFINSIGVIPVEMEIEEKLLGFEVKIDGALAAVWTPYQFYINGKLAHCGVNSLQLVKSGGEWQIVYLIDTRRKEGC